MSTGREKDQKDYDLENLAQVLDTALASDNPGVKNALRNLLIVSAIVSSELPQESIMGPLSRVFEDNRNLNQRLSRLEDELNQLKWQQQKQRVEPFMPTVPAVGPYPGTGSPQWPDTWTGTSPNGPKPMWGSTWSAGDDPNYTGAQSVINSMKADLSAIKNVMAKDSK